VIQDPAEYCRQIETYLCGKNEGHLIRIVGPAFEQVCGWAEQGVPLKVAFRGIDRYCERYYAKGPRRRPVRIEFCEADILELFDDWRRAVGVGTATGDADVTPPRKEPLVAHVERAVARLTALRGGGRWSAAFGERVDAVVRELDRLAPDARAARGEERARIIARLSELDAELLAAARTELRDEALADLRREADAELAPFGSRMDAATRTRAVDVAFQRLVREAAGLPVLEYD
jgi:hypothetical protein